MTKAAAEDTISTRVGRIPQGGERAQRVEPLPGRRSPNSRAPRRALAGSLSALLPALVAGMACGGCSQGQSDNKISYSQPDAAEETEFDRVSNPVPNAKTMYAYSRVLQGKGEDARCALALANLIEKYPEFRPAYADLADLQVRHGRIGAAVRTLSAGLAISSRDPVLYNNLGMCWMLQGEFNRALSHFTCAAAESPQDARYRANMAAALGMLGRYEESLALYMQVLPPHDAHHNLEVVREARLKLTPAAGRTDTSVARRHDSFKGLAALPLTSAPVEVKGLPLHTRPQPNTPASIAQPPPYMEGSGRRAAFTQSPHDEQARPASPASGRAGAAPRPRQAASSSGRGGIPHGLISTADPANPIEFFAEARLASPAGSGAASPRLGTTVAPSARAPHRADHPIPTIVTGPLPTLAEAPASIRNASQTHGLDLIRDTCRRLVVVEAASCGEGPKNDHRTPAPAGVAVEKTVAAAAFGRCPADPESVWIAGQDPAWPAASSWTRAVLPLEPVGQFGSGRFLPDLGSEKNP